jgi:hypothetical protein
MIAQGGTTAAEVGMELPAQGRDWLRRTVPLKNPDIILVLGVVCQMLRNLLEEFQSGAWMRYFT